MKTVFKTNLDVAQPFLVQLADADGANFLVGDLVMFFGDIGNTPHANIRTFHLVVIARTHDLRTGLLVIELHKPQYGSQTISEWEEWFSRNILGRDR